MVSIRFQIVKQNNCWFTTFWGASQMKYETGLHETVPPWVETLKEEAGH